MARANRNSYTIRTVRTKEDRRRPSVFMRLKTDEAFKGVALFEPDPELGDNPFYYEYYDHYDKQGNAYVPCTGDRCPFCAANDNPSTRALTVWYLPSEGNKGDQIKVFTMNFSTTQDMTDEAEEEGGLLGKTVRVKRLSDKGDYRVRITNDKKLTQRELKDVMGQAEEKFPNGLEGLVQRQLEIQMERLKALEAMDDDEDEDEEREERTSARRGRASSARSNGRSRARADEDEDEGDEEEGEDEEGTSSVEEQEFELLKVSKRNNSVTVEIDGEESELVGDEDEIDVGDFKKGDTVIISAEWDEDDESWVLTAIEAAEEAEDEDGDEEADDDGEGEEEEGEEEGEEEEDESNSVVGGTFEVVRVEEDDEILHLKNDEGRFKMWVGEGVNPDYDAIKKGVQVTIDAETDEEGDWIVTKVAPVVARQSRTRKTTTARGTSKKTTATSRSRKR